jgi:NADH-quinone oxidoreductase subunit A
MLDFFRTHALTPPAGDAVATLVFFLVVFMAVGVIFLFFHLVMGSFLRPNVPDPEKLTIYECGEPTVGSAWVQFDLRYYVVALLFVIFDVEVAFFFPWAVVFGKANQLADANLPEERRQVLSRELAPMTQDKDKVETIKPAAAAGWAALAFWDILVFFGVLLVGFAYLWRRGDIDWIRTVTHRGGEHPVGQAEDSESTAA